MEATSKTHGNLKAKKQVDTLLPTLYPSICSVASHVVLPRGKERKEKVGFLSWQSSVQWVAETGSGVTALQCVSCYNGFVVKEDGSIGNGVVRALLGVGGLMVSQAWHQNTGTALRPENAPSA